MVAFLNCCQLNASFEKRVIRVAYKLFLTATRRRKCMVCRCVFDETVKIKFRDLEES
jgi:hypothetical protein